jgi:septal ring factor EnvC (AmiA/AmiB activator)
MNQVSDKANMQPNQEQLGIETVLAKLKEHGYPVANPCDINGLRDIQLPCGVSLILSEYKNLFDSSPINQAIQEKDQILKQQQFEIEEQKLEIAWRRDKIDHQYDDINQQRNDIDRFTATLKRARILMHSLHAEVDSLQAQVVFRKLQVASEERDDIFQE